LVTDSDIREMIRKYRRDLLAFQQAKATIQRRTLELESDAEHHDMFVNWAATQVVVNGLVMCISRLMGMIEDLENNLKSRNAPVFSLVGDHAGDDNDDV
jgi:hypothetical protein